MLEVKEIHTYYGTSHILFGLSLEVNEGEVVCLLGRNGAGKSTTLRSIIGLTPPRSGSIKFKGLEIIGKPPYRIAPLGIGFVPDDRRIFPDLTVRQNILVARRETKGAIWDLGRIYSLFPKLKELESHMGNQLSGGEQQMLTIARTLMTNPQLLLLDEPGEGLAPLVIKAMETQLGEIKKLGTTMLICEHNVGLATALSDRAYVMDKGTIRYQGTIEELRKNEEVKKKYLMV
ncbi:MAG: ABC transporter ATP-binding protein [Deltaproteobacteria bacterium]|nr:ABC transporter ATP-binding protein [Deltaproteobacteria bacterium]MBM4323680.1 ABC transporter ATP-binding protein [Deltaproteobacteria bacterium]MBM4346628.1 ABC transporter ATP-binding protein [Deltaproteobacteria bacterium]